MHFHKPQEKPSRWGSFADVQYAIRVNSEKIYDCDPDDDVLVMPLFWGLPPLDYSGYNNHGTNHGATYKDGSLDFDGVDDYVVMPIIDISDWDGITISSWVKWQSIVDNEHTIISNYYSLHPSVPYFSLQLEPDCGNCIEAFLLTEANTLIGQEFTDLTLVDDVWYQVVVTYDLTTMKVYLDTQISATMPTGGIFDQSSKSTNTFMGSEYGTSEYFDGLIDEVRISNVARTADQIALFNDNKYGLYQPVSRPIWSIPSGLTLTIAAIDGAGLLDNVVLTQKHNLAIQGMSGAGSIDSTILTQKHLLALQELLSSGAIDNISLTQKHNLAVQELLSSGAIDNIELIVSALLVVSDMLSTGAIDNTALTQKHILSINEIISDSQIDGLALTQKHLLIINNLISSGIINNISFDVAVGLIYITLSQATEYNITLSQATEYNITLSQTTEYNITLSQTGGGV